MDQDEDGTTDDFEQTYLSLNGVPTEIITFGLTISELSNLEHPPKTMILMIPGNPGVIKYYEEFMRCLFQSFNGSCPVWGISHAGHSREPNDQESSKSPLISGNENMYNLKGQVKHKKFFITDFIPDSVRLILIGHSIGAYVTLELLKILPDPKVSKAILLFPTIERMAISPNGKWCTPLVRHFRPLPVLFSYLGKILPYGFKSTLIRWYFKGSNIPECIYEATLDFIEPSIVKSSLEMACDEMEKVVDLDSVTIEANQDKLILYYGGSDHWCPVSYYLDIKDAFPALDARLCEKGIAHAFVVTSSHEMAEQVSDWLNKEVTGN